jgi:phosphatidylglycerophosphatase A
MDWPQPRWTGIFSTRFVCAVATLGPIGTRLPAPGTWGSLVGLVYAMVFWRYARWEVTLVWTAIAAYVAVAFCGDAARRLGKGDPGEIVLDEFVAVPLVFLAWRHWHGGLWPEWAVLLLGFGLFRLYDIVKPFGIRRLQRWNAGWGIVADDIAAALAAGATLHALAVLWRLLH